jgi:thymidylate synthase (FAD)
VRDVTPEVFLVASPKIEFEGMQEYLDRVEGQEWWDRVTHDDDAFFAAEGEVLVEFGGRLCYRSWAPGLNANVTKIREDSREYLGNILASKHGSVLEHANYSFVLHNVSRVLTHEFVRHRVGIAVSQESLRFVRLTDIPMWMPEWVKDYPVVEAYARDLVQHMEDFQTFMAAVFELDSPDVPFSEKKHKTSFMRRFAPEGVATGMLVTINVRTLRHIIAMRTSLGAEEEIRIVCDQIAGKTLEAVPNLMQDYSVNEDREWIPEFLKV